MDEYKLSEVLEGHKLDVRCVFSFPSGAEIGKNLLMLNLGVKYHYIMYVN